MKYTQYILQNIIPEWVKLYLNYKLLKTYLSLSSALKTLLVLAKKTKTKEEYRDIKGTIMQTSILIDKLEYDNNQFIQNFAEEAEKVEAFTLYKYFDLKQKLARLQGQVRAMRMIREDIGKRKKILNKKKKKGDKNMVFDDFDIPLAEEESVDESILQQDIDDLKINKKILVETFYRFYNETLHFQSYMDINQEGIRKILKKYRKQMIKGIRKKQKEKQHFGQILEKISMHNISSKVKSLLFDIEQMMIQNFYPTKPKRCRENLRKYSINIQLKRSQHFAFGFFAGFAFMFVIILIFLRYEGYMDPIKDKLSYQVFPIFRGFALYLIYFWFLAMDVWMCNYFRINYKIYLGFNHHFSTLTEILRRIMIFSALYLLIMVIYILQIQHIGHLTNDLQIMNPNYLPLLLWAIGFLYLFMPSKRLFNGPGRKWMIRLFLGALFFHFIKYESRYTFLTEQFVSLVTPFVDLGYTICFYYHFFFYGEGNQQDCYETQKVTCLLFGILPFVIMCIQFITRARDYNNGKFYKTDEMWNFIKNILSIQLGLISYLSFFYNPLKYVWLVLAVVCVVYQFYWDLKKDWVLMQPNAQFKVFSQQVQNQYLRNDLGYDNPYIYYAIASLNILLRSNWAIAISPNIYQAFSDMNPQLIILIVGFLELVRSFQENIFLSILGMISNFLKIEKEHITNQRLFRTVMDYQYPFDNKTNMVRLNEQQTFDLQIIIDICFTYFSDLENKTHWSISTFNRPVDFHENSQLNESRMNFNSEVQLVMPGRIEEKKTEKQNSSQILEKSVGEQSLVLPSPRRKEETKQKQQQIKNEIKQQIEQSQNPPYISPDKQKFITRSGSQHQGLQSLPDSVAEEQWAKKPEDIGPRMKPLLSLFRLTYAVAKDSEVQQKKQSKFSSIDQLQKKINLELLNKANQQELFQFSKVNEIQESNKKYKEVLYFIFLYVIQVIKGLYQKFGISLK